GRIIDANGLGRDDTTDLLVVGLSASDIVGHSYGPASQEYLDTILRVDRWLDEFIQHAEAAGAASRGGVVFALSSDHGVLPLPETLPWGRRIDREALLSRFEAALNASLDPEEPDHFVESFHSGHIYFDRRALGRHDVSIDRAREQARKILTGLAGIVRVYRPVDLAASSGGDPFLELYRHSYDPRRGGDLVVQPCRGCLLVSSAEGTSHGSPYADDRDVPMILMGPGIEPASRTRGVARWIWPRRWRRLPAWRSTRNVTGGLSP
ncbi:MAG: alkaline phosphatase family protein, partial [Acidobacteriota bacterium]